ncbi:MAG: DUF2236 domain-containing protein [Pyrinomonadaceae bacterium]|nr:DUF2236 domain-containing protein [Pyrinomonadaceae bacterium]
MMRDFVEKNSIVRRIWSNPDLILLVFAGSAAEFALNRAVDWLFFTGKIPKDPIGRFFSTVSYAQEIVFASENEAIATVKRIGTIHSGVEKARGQKIPDWAYRDVLYMLIDYSKRSFELLFRPLTNAEKDDLFSNFRRLGELMELTKLPKNYADWEEDRLIHIEQDLEYSALTKGLYEQYEKQLGAWRYELLLEIQALIVPPQVRQLLKLNANNPLSYLIWSYSLVDGLGLQSLARWALLPSEHLEAVERLNRQ